MEFIIAHLIQLIDSEPVVVYISELAALDSVAAVCTILGIQLHPILHSDHMLLILGSCLLTILRNPEDRYHKRDECQHDKGTISRLLDCVGARIEYIEQAAHNYQKQNNV